MAVQVFIGEKPEHPNERRAIVALANGLERLESQYLILANFSVGGRSIDLVIAKPDGLFIIELKHCDGKVFGDVNGPWYVEGSNGERKRLNPGRKNPYNQVISYYYSLINFLNDRRGEFLSPQKAPTVDFRTCRRVVVIAPTIQEGSKVETDWKVELKGLDELPAYLVTERSSEIDLTLDEMLRIPELLNLTRWTEINALLAGVLPRWEEAGEAPPAEVAAPPPAPTPEPAEAVAPPPAEAPARYPRLRRLTTTWLGRATLALSALVVLLAAMLLRPAAAPLPDQPAQSALVSTSLPAGAADAGAFAAPSSCVWSGYQPVGRRRGAQEGVWENMGVSGVAPGLEPDVVVTLEEVEFCDGQITLTWSLRNNLESESVALPLTAENVVVRDSLGNSYSIDAALSRPEELRAAPGGRAEGRAVIPRPANLSAPTLVVQLMDQPFGETTWLVPIGTATP